jgi:xanthine dehydrogenase/oxidase
MTTSGIGSKRGGFHPVQEAIADGNGSQCGFCTPGWVMHMYALLAKKEAGGTKPSAKEIEQHFDGNLCRCTGYRPILTAFGKFAAGAGGCKSKGPAVGSTQHPPAMLKQLQPLPLHFIDAETGTEYYRPTSLSQFSAVVSAASASKKVLRPFCASTADGVVKYMAQPDHTENNFVLCDIGLLPDLGGAVVDHTGATFGAAVPIAVVIEALEADSDPAYTMLASHMKRIASAQIRSVASWAGNIMLTKEYPKFASDSAFVFG